jgi:PKD repeat protein
VYDAVLPFSFDITSVLCDTACAGALAVDMCDSAGFYCSGLGPYAYSWSANTGSQTGPSAVGLCGGTYQVTVTDAADCIGVGEAVVTSSAMVQELCIVTVDSTSTYNSVVWEKPTTAAIDSFRVYRDIVGTYTHIGSVAYGDLSEFVDNTNGVSPAVTSYRYKMSTVDTCGNESALSTYHETIHLTVSLGTPPAYNLIWDNYEGIGFLYYRILRDSVGNGEFGVIDSVTASNFTYTDPTPPAGNMTYAIEVVHPSGCTADKVKNFNSSKSNTSTGVGGALNASIASNDATPGNCDGNATVSATGGTPPYTYLWNTSPVQTTSIATGLCAGSFSVTVTDNVGDSITSSVLINESSGPLPAAEFTSDKTAVAPGDSVNFIDLSSNTPTGWSWIFTNGTPATSSDQNPSNIVYNVNGCHDVTLIATNGNGSGNITKTCYIEVGTIGLYDDSRMVSHRIAPNPFEHSIVFRYTCQKREKVAVRIINLLGELVYSFDGFSKAGENEVEWGIELPGVYMLDARIGDRFISEKVVKL